jgi:hypothetical protein
MNNQVADKLGNAVINEQQSRKVLEPGSVFGCMLEFTGQQAKPMWVIATSHELCVVKISNLAIRNLAVVQLNR